MGCSESKADHLPLVVRCRERRDLVRAAENHRYALASAHVSYFRSLKDVGDALRMFADEEELASASTSASSSSPSFSSPSLTLPRNPKQKHGDGEGGESHLNLSSSSPGDGDSDFFAHRVQNHKHQNHVRKRKKGFGHLRSDGETSSSHYPRGGFNESEEGNQRESSSRYPPRDRDDFYDYGDGFRDEFSFNGFGDEYGEPYVDRWGPQGIPAQPWYKSNSSNVYYLKNAAQGAHTVVQKPPVEPSNSYWSSSVVGYGYASSSEGVKVNPPPPPSPKDLVWDFFNPFDGLNNKFVDYYSSGRYGYGSNHSSPDLNEVREREGIPDLEEETESEVHNEVLKGNRVKVEVKESCGEKKSSSHSIALPNLNNSDGGSRSASQHRREGKSSRKGSLHKCEGNSKSVASWSSKEIEKACVAPQYNKGSVKRQCSEKSVEPPISLLHQSPSREIESSLSSTDENSSPEIDVVSESVDGIQGKKKGMRFEVEVVSNKQDGDLSKLNSMTLLSPSGRRDLREVVAEIRDEFETAAGYGKEVAVMLEVGKMPYQPSFLKVLSRILHPISPSMSSLDTPSMKSEKLSSKTVKLAQSYFADVGKDENSKACNLSSTLDRLYTWEKKLYKEVKDEEKLRIMYEKQCKKLNNLDHEGAESSKIDATRASISRLLTKLNVSVKAIDAISIRIQKLRDEELQPQVAGLINGLIRMWKAMLKCHQKQFRAVMESKMRRLKENTALQSDPTIGLERELNAWCEHFNEWISSQKSYAESLNLWLQHCLQYEPEERPDGPDPYSPGRLGAPPVFVILNDWHQAMKAISEVQVANAMNTFATSLHHLWEKRDEEGQQRLRAEYLSKDYRTLEMDSMREKVSEERGKHEDASGSLQGGLVPILKALEIFTSEALKSHEHVRLEHSRPNL